MSEKRPKFFDVLQKASELPNTFISVNDVLEDLVVAYVKEYAMFKFYVYVLRSGLEIWITLDNQERPVAVEVSEASCSGDEE